MDHKLGGVLDGLVLEEVKSSDIEISPLTSIEEKRWFDMRNSTLFNPAFGNPFGLLVGSSGLMGKRHTMEDEVAIIPDLNASLTLPFTMPDHAYFAVYDGHSGSEVSKMLTEKLHVYICDSPDFETDIVSSLVTAFVVRCSRSPCLPAYTGLIVSALAGL